MHSKYADCRSLARARTANRLLPVISVSFWFHRLEVLEHAMQVHRALRCFSTTILMPSSSGEGSRTRTVFFCSRSVRMSSQTQPVRNHLKAVVDLPRGTYCLLTGSNGSCIPAEARPGAGHHAPRLPAAMLMLVPTVRAWIPAALKRCRSWPSVRQQTQARRQPLVQPRLSP